MATFYPAITEKVTKIIEMLREEINEQNVYEVYDEFADREAQNPIYVPTATVGIKKLESENKWFMDYLGIADGKRVFGKYVTVTYGITIHSPTSMGGGACRKFLCHIRDVFYKDRSFISASIESGEIKYDSLRRCLYMPVYIQVKYTI